jgi:malonate-semialdehyde dehydrogenase (acetylating)/methylmalonate-semialdehyde dehydrogenase
MIALWSIPLAIATGNTLIVKPSERDPGATAIIAELCERAGLPKGVLSIVHGGVDTVNFIWCVRCASCSWHISKARAQ